MNADTSPLLTVEGRIATITLRNPARSNSLSPQDLDALRAHVQAVNDMPNVLVLRFVAQGKYFCSGYNIMALADRDTPGSGHFGATVDAVEAARPVTIAAIHGGVYGGGTDLGICSCPPLGWACISTLAACGATSRA